MWLRNCFMRDTCCSVVGLLSCKSTLHKLEKAVKLEEFGLPKLLEE